MTPTLSVEAVQLRLIALLLVALAPRPDGAVGAWVSGAFCVVADAVLE